MRLFKFAPLALLPLLAGCATVKITGTPLEKAIALGDGKQVEALLKGGADPNRRDLLTRISPACRSIRSNHIDILKILIAHGANIVKESDALYCAVDSGQLDTVKFLIGQGAPIGEFAVLRSQDHQPEIASYLKQVKEERAQATGTTPVAPPAPVPAPTPAPAPAPVAVSTPTAAAPASSGTLVDVFVPFNVPARPLDIGVAVAVGPDAEQKIRVAAAHMTALGYPADRILRVVGAEAGHAGLVKTVEGILPKVVKNGATVFFYFAGKSLSANGKEYLMPADGDPAFPEETAYPVSRLIEKLGAVHARLTVVVLDAPVALSGDAPAGLYAIASGPNLRPGAFARLFFEGLDGAAKGPNDVVTLGSLGDYVSEHSAPATAIPSRARLAEVVLH
jgi:hypothetical protein